MAYATTDDVANGFRELSPEEEDRASYLLDDAAIIIDSYNANATDEAKNYVSKSLVRRMLSTTDPTPYESTTMTAGPYSRSYTLPSTNGEMYLTKLEKGILRGTSGSVGFAPASLGRLDVGGE